jgi:hypothetical protein
MPPARGGESRPRALAASVYSTKQLEPVGPPPSCKFVAKYAKRVQKNESVARIDTSVTIANAMSADAQ